MQEPTGTLRRPWKVFTTEPSVTRQKAELSEAFYVAVGLQRGEDNVHQPQAKEQTGGENLGDSGSAELPADFGPPAVEEHSNADECKDGEERDGEGERARVNLKLLALGVVVDGSDGPGHANTQEDVDSVTTCNVADWGVGILVLDGCHLTGKGVWGGEKGETVVFVWDGFEVDSTAVQIGVWQRFTSPG